MKTEIRDEEVKAVSSRDHDTHPKRQYPPLYEKALPIVLTMIGIAFVVLLLFVFGVALGLFPAAR